MMDVMLQITTTVDGLDKESRREENEKGNEIKYKSCFNKPSRMKSFP